MTKYKSIVSNGGILAMHYYYVSALSLDTPLELLPCRPNPYHILPVKTCLISPQTDHEPVAPTKQVH